MCIKNMFFSDIEIFEFLIDSLLSKLNKLFRRVFKTISKDGILVSFFKTILPSKRHKNVLFFLMFFTFFVFSLRKLLITFLIL